MEFSRHRVFAHRPKLRDGAVGRTVLAALTRRNTAQRVRGFPENVGDMSPVLGA